MSDKSYVTMEQNLCIVCLEDFDTGAILMDKRLRNQFDRYTRTGWGMCPQCTKKRDEGYIALIECDPTKTKVVDGTHVKSASDVYRTGTIMHIRATIWPKVFDAPVPEKMVAFIDPEAVAKIKGFFPPEPE